MYHNLSMDKYTNFGTNNYIWAIYCSRCIVGIIKDNTRQRDINKIIFIKKLYPQYNIKAITLKYYYSNESWKINNKALKQEITNHVLNLYFGGSNENNKK